MKYVLYTITGLLTIIYFLAQYVFWGLSLSHFSNYLAFIWIISFIINIGIIIFDKIKKIKLFQIIILTIIVNIIFVNILSIYFGFSKGIFGISIFFEIFNKHSFNALFMSGNYLLPFIYLFWRFAKNI